MATIRLGLDRCVLCRSAAPEDWEHIIPEALGGRLKVDLLCKPCNHGVGASLVSRLTRDPGVILAVENLKGEIPKLHSAFTRHVTYVAPGPDGDPMEIRDGKLRTRASKEGSLLIASEIAEVELERRMRRMGLPKADIQQQLTAWSTLPDGATLEIAPGLEIKRWTVETQVPKLGESLIDHRWPVLAALEFLALNLKDGILTPYFEEIQDYVLGGQQPSFVAVERLTTRKYAPFHGMRWIQREDVLVCEIHLFGWIVFSVTFSSVRMQGPLAAYLESLDTGKSALSQRGWLGDYQLLNP